MKFNDLRTGMVIGEVLFKNDPQMYTNYTIKVIDNIDGDKAYVTTYGYSADGDGYSFFRGKHKKFGGPKDFGISKNINDFGDDDKIEFITAIFEGGVN